jgi:hypothetical protein
MDPQHCVTDLHDAWENVGVGELILEMADLLEVLSGGNKARFFFKLPYCRRYNVFPGLDLSTKNSRRNYQKQAETTL